ncbi:MAG: hypothetical protein KDA85_10810 [Planctomycetaceae bacterium]|nr:hypothetical protein [Planctomycetaceae bacterium]
MKGSINIGHPTAHNTPHSLNNPNAPSSNQGKTDGIFNRGVPMVFLMEGCEHSGNESHDVLLHSDGVSDVVSESKLREVFHSGATAVPHVA